LSFRSGTLEEMTRSVRGLRFAGPWSIIIHSSRNAKGFTGKVAMAAEGDCAVAWGRGGDETAPLFSEEVGGLISFLSAALLTIQILFLTPVCFL
jgi:hypothetical protein